MSPGGREALVGLLLAVVVTALLAAVPLLPPQHGATAVGVMFLGASWWWVWRKDDATVREHGMELGGLVVPGVRASELLRRGLRAAGFALLLAAVFFVPFALGFTRWFSPRHAWSMPFSPLELGREACVQVALVAFPEEAFYRGVVQSKLARGETRRLRVLGAEVGWSLPLTSALFAIGHVCTIHSPARLAVFFPSLVFGWLRLRTGGLGAAVLFHALCNLWSELLGRGYGLY